MRRCPSCSTQNRENARVCIQCGASLQGADEGGTALRPPSHMLDPAMEPMTIRPELEALLKKMAPEGGDAVITLHLFGKNYPINRIEHLKILLDKNLIREDAPILHRDRGRWMEAQHVAASMQNFDPEKTPRPEEQVSPTGRSEKRPSHADLILAARLGREAEQAASRGEIERAIEIYQQVVQLNERYPLVQKRLRELGKLLEEKQGGGASEPEERPVLNTLPLPKPPPSSSSQNSPSAFPRKEPSGGALQLQKPGPFPSNPPASSAPRSFAPPSRHNTGEQPRVPTRPPPGFPSSEQPRVGHVTGERPRVGYSGEQPRVGGGYSGEQSRIGGGYSGEQARIGGGYSGERPRVGAGYSGEQPRVGAPQMGRTEGSRSSSEHPQVPTGRPFSNPGSPQDPRRSPFPLSNDGGMLDHRPGTPRPGGSSGQLGVLPLPREDARGGSPYPVSIEPRDVGAQSAPSPFIPQGRAGTPIPRPSASTPAPRHYSGTNIPQQRPASAFAEPPDRSGAPGGFSPPPMFEEEEPTQMAPFDFSGAAAAVAASSTATSPVASPGGAVFGAPSGAPSAFGAPPPDAAPQYPAMFEEEEPTQMSGSLFPDGIPGSVGEEDASVVLNQQSASWGGGVEPLAPWRLDEGNDTQPWQRIHCHQPVLSLEVQVDRLYALLESGMRVVSYRFPGGQPIAECTLPSVGSMLLATASGLAVLHPQDGLFSLWDRSNLSGIVQVPVGKMPADMALLSRNHVLVANSGDGTLSIIDLQRGAETERFQVGGAPIKILQHPRHLLILHRGHPQITLWPLTGPARN
ncbi:MAG: hypothetical protein H6728_09460 [Myxococcales bacterium]|nr:hypothetical protein [Myxococcales bacterium]